MVILSMLMTVSTVASAFIRSVPDLLLTSFAINQHKGA